MKNTMLCGALLTLVCAQIQAETTQQPVPANTSEKSPAPVAPAPSPNVQAVPAQPIKQPAVQPIPTEKPKTPTAINCDYKISRETKTIDQSLVLSWTEKAVIQAFDFDPSHMDQQLDQLKVCFTDTGWNGFKSALDKSGNIEAIKSQKLTVSSQVDGQPQMVEDKNNQWKVALPLQVVYQNDKEKVTQLLNVNLIIARKLSGDLGIVQMIATPRVAAGSPDPAADTQENTDSKTETPAAQSGSTDKTKEPATKAPTENSSAPQ